MARLDTRWHEDPKVLQLGFAAMGLHAWGISYCDATESDGKIFQGAWPALPGVAALVRQLVQAGLWEPCEGGFQVHNYAKYNRLKAQIDAERVAIAERVKRHRNGVSNAVTTDPGNAAGNAFLLARAGAPGPGPGRVASVVNVSGPGTRDPNDAPRRAARSNKKTDEPSALRPGQQQCPLCPEVFPDNASLRDHVDNSPRHKIRPEPETFKGRRRTRVADIDPTPPEVLTELEAMSSRPAPELPADIKAEHERYLARERAHTAHAPDSV